MPIYVPLPNGMFAEFPDGTSPEEIDRILREEDQRALVPQERGTSDTWFPTYADFEAKTVQGGLRAAGGLVDMAQPDAAPPLSERTRPLELMAQRVLESAPAKAALGVASLIAPPAATANALVTGLANAGRGAEVAKSLGADVAAMMSGRESIRDIINAENIKPRLAENERRAAEGRPSLEEETAAQPASRLSRSILDAADAVYENFVSERTKAGDFEGGRAYDESLVDWLQFAAESPSDAVLQLGPTTTAFLIGGTLTGAAGRAAGLSGPVNTGLVTQTQGIAVSEMSARDQQDRVLGMSDEDFAQTPTGSYLIGELGLEPKAAKEQAARLAYDTTLAASLPLNAAAMSLTTRLGGNPVEEALAGARNLNASTLTMTGLKGRSARAAATAGRESAGEFVQGATEQMASNIGAIGAGLQDRSTVFSDVAKAGVIEGIAGAPFGAAVGATQAPMSQEQIAGLRAIEAARIARERLSVPADPSSPLSQGIKDARAVIAAARAGQFTQPQPQPQPEPQPEPEQQPQPAQPEAQPQPDVPRGTMAPEIMAAPTQPTAQAAPVEAQQPTQAQPFQPAQAPQAQVQQAPEAGDDISGLLDLAATRKGFSLEPQVLQTEVTPEAQRAMQAWEQQQQQRAQPAVEPPAATAPAVETAPQAQPRPPSPPLQSRSQTQPQSRAPGEAVPETTPPDTSAGQIRGPIAAVADYGQTTTGSGRVASAMLKSLGLTAEEAVIAKSVRDVPELAAVADQTDERTEGMYYNGRVYIFEDAIENGAGGGRRAMERATWVAVHEAVKHRGLDMLFTPEQKSALMAQADANSLIRSIADDIEAEAGRDVSAGDRGARRAGRDVYVEEAMAEIAAAMLTNNYEALFARYQGAARQTLKPAEGIVRRAARAAWNTLRGRSGVTFTERDVLRLMADSYRATTTMRGRGWAARAPQPAGDQAQQPASGQEPGRNQSRGVNVEVAPDPRNGRLKEAFGSMPEARKREISERLGSEFIPRILSLMDVNGYEIEHTIGGFAGDTNPSIILRFSPDSSFDQMVEAGKVIGSVFSQQAIIAYDEQLPGTTGFVKLTPNRTLSYEEQSAVFKAVYSAFPSAEGFTAREGDLVFGNFGGTDNTEFLNKIEGAAASVAVGSGPVEFTTSLHQFRSDWIEPVSLEGTRYGQRDDQTQEPASGGNSVRREGGTDSIQAIQRDFSDAFERELGAPLQSRAAGARRPGVRGAAPEGGAAVSPFPTKAPRFAQRRVQRDAVTVQAIHYSSVAGLSSLDGKKAGTGSAGGERRRFGLGNYGAEAGPGDTARRLYFYVQRGDVAPRPEDAVSGRERYAVALTNLYDIKSDPRGLREEAGVNEDFLEELVNEAGFDGILFPPVPGIEGETAVLFGLSKRVPVVFAPLQSRAAPMQSRSPVADPFYSALLRSVESGKGAPKRGDATAWKGWLDGAQRRGEFRQSERDWLGVDAWLDGQGEVTKAALVEFVRANQVQVSETVLGGTKPMSETEWDRFNELSFVEDKTPEQQREFDELNRRAGEVPGGGLDPKFASYQLPGGSNYRELLLTLPAPPPIPGKKGRPATRREVVQVFGAFPGQFETRDEAQAFVDRITEMSTMPDMEGVAEALSRFPLSIGTNIVTVDHGTPDEPSRPAPGTFISGHFDQPNILAHVRFNERTDADGKRVLFVEEVQSDWHQQGRKRGYAEPLPDMGVPRVEVRTTPISEQFDPEAAGESLDAYIKGRQEQEDALAKEQRRQPRVIDANTPAQFSYRDGKIVSVRLWPTVDDETAAYNLSRSVDRMNVERRNEAARKNEGRVPDAPLKKEWPLTAMKRMIRWAAENGFDRIAWTTGEQQAERYDLSKQVDRIAYAKTSAGNFNIKVYRGGENVLNRTDVTEADAENLVGKEIVQKMNEGVGETNFATGYRELSGLNLKLGGEGMRAFYDKMLPNELGKYVKKWGANVGQVKMMGANAREAKAFPNRKFEPDLVAHAIDITTAMRESVMAGQPLFSRAPPIDSPEFRAWFGDSKVVDEDGRPLVVYHGTGADITVFRSSRQGWYGKGMYFTDDATLADEYALNADEGQNIMPVYLSMERPYVYREPAYYERDAGDEANFDLIRDVLPREKAQRLIAKMRREDTGYVGRQLQEALREMGHDGLIIESSSSPGAREFIVFSPDQIKSATGNVGAFGQRPVTAAEAAPLGLTAEEANEAQARGDIRFSRAPRRPDNLVSPREITPEFVKRLRERKSFLAGLIRTEGRTLEQIRTDGQRAMLLVQSMTEASAARDFDADIAEAEEDLKRARKASLAGDRAALRQYDAIRDLLAVLKQGRRRMMSDGNQALRLAQRIAEASQVMTPADRESILATLEPMLTEAEQAYVAHRKIMQWRRGRAYARIKAFERQTDALNFLAAEGYQQGQVLWDASEIIAKKDSLRRRIRSIFQDKYIDLRDIQDVIEDQLGAELEDAQNLYRAENLMHGRVSDQMKSFNEQHVEPLKVAIKASGFTVEQVERYLWAKHATERNARIREINRDNDAGSGMTDGEAEKVLASFTPEQKRRIEPVAKRLKAIRRFTLKTLVDAGQIDQATMDTLLGMYSDYVPLRTRRQGEGEERIGGTGQGLSAGRSGIERALGRSTPPENIISEMVGDAQRAILQAGKAEVGRALLRLVLSYPQPELWDVEPVVLTPQFSEATGEVYLAAGKPDDAETVIVKHKGKPYRVRIKHPRLVAAIKNSTGGLNSALVRYFGWMTRHLSAVLTRFNPAFVPINMMRDALQGLAGVAAELGPDSMYKVINNYGASLSAVYRQARQNTGNASKPDAEKTIDDWAREFYESGAPTGMAALDDMDTINADIEMTMQTFMQAAKRHPIGATAKLITEARIPFSDIKPLQIIENANEAVENGIRLSTYMHLRKDKGWSKQRAATYAKEMTVNFNRRGSVGSAMNALWLFYNAAVQGSRRTLKLLSEQKGIQALVASLATGQAMFAVALGMQTFGDDDETLWEKIPDHVKLRSFIPYMWFDKDGTPRWVSIPMPYGFNLFPAAGGIAANYASPNYRGKVNNPLVDVLSRLTSATIDAFSPVAIGEERSMWPTVVGIAMQMQANRDDLGNQITPSASFREESLPLSTLYKPGTSELFIAAAKALNEIGGGTDYSKPMLPGLLDWSPNQLEFLFNTVTGGPGTVLTGFYRQAARSAATGDAALYETPVARSIVGGVRQERQEMRRFYEERERVNVIELRLRDAFKRGGEAEFIAERERIGPLAEGIELRRMKRDGKSGRAGEVAVNPLSGSPTLSPVEGSVAALQSEAESMVRELTSQMRSIYNDTSIGVVERERRIIELQKQRAEAVREFNRAASRARTRDD